MRQFILFLFFVFCFQFSFGQKLHGVESEYTVQYGYRYFFDEINVATGAITQLTQLPITNYFADTYFTNCKGNSVFIAIDSSSTSINYFNFYEVDSTGSIISVVPADTSTYFRYMYVREAMDGSVYYALFLNTDIPGWETQMVLIDKQTGARTPTGALTGSVFNTQMGQISENLEADNSVYASGYASTVNGLYGYLYKINLAAGTVDLLDSAANTYYMNMYYDCTEDLTYGFLVNMSNQHLTGSQYFFIDQLENVVLPGISINGAGNNAWSWTEVLLPDGRYLLKTGSNISIFDDVLTGPVYTPSNVPIPGNDVKLWMGPLMNCAAQVDCSEPIGITELHENTFSLYPSPNESGIFNINESLDAKYTVFDLSGRIVKEGNIHHSCTLNLEKMPAGTYFVKFISEKSTELFKIMIK